MTETEIEENLEQAFSLAREVVEDPDAFPIEFVTFHLGDEAVLRILTEERLRLLRLLREGPSRASPTLLGPSTATQAGSVAT